MIPVLLWVPVLTSCILGFVYLFTGEGGLVAKALIAAVFLSAAYLQFATRFSLLGLLLQCALALGLATWWKIQARA